MSSTLVRPVVASRDRYPLAVDAFLYAAVIFLIGMGLQLLATYWVSGGALDPEMIPFWVAALGQVAMLAPVVGGPLLGRVRLCGHRHGSPGLPAPTPPIVIITPVGSPPRHGW